MLKERVLSVISDVTYITVLQKNTLLFPIGIVWDSRRLRFDKIFDFL